MNLSIKNLSVSRNGKPILSNISFDVAPSELVIIRGRNGAGKSTLLSAIMNLPGVEVTDGDVCLGDESLCSKKTHEIARAGIFLSHQEPPAIDGVSLGTIARAALESLCGISDVPAAQKRIRETLAELSLPDDFTQKTLHSTMSGGEKKRAELFLLVLIKPKFALLDELDSGLDAASCDLAKTAIANLRSQGTGFVVVTHSDGFAENLKATKIIEIKA